MKALNHFSEGKFRALGKDQQKKALIKMVEAIEASIHDLQAVTEILSSLKECAAWMEDDVPQAISAFLSSCEAGYDARMIMRACSVCLDAYGATRKDHAMPIRMSDGSPEADPAALKRAKGIIVILEDLRSVFNVGSIFRSSECLGIREIWLCGITPIPLHPAFGRTAMGTAEKVAWRSCSNAVDAIREAKRTGYKVVAIETVEGADSVFESSFEMPLALVLGNESLGISQEVLSICDAVASIPVLGWKNSLNVGVAFALAAYQVVFGGARNATNESDEIK